MKFYKKVLLLSILILSGLLSSSSISRAETFTISATDSYLVDGPTFNTELKNAMAVIGNNGTLPSITSINLVDEPFTSDINVAQSGKPIYMKANYLGSSNPNFIASVHLPYKSGSTTEYDRTNITKNSFKLYKYTFEAPGTYTIDVDAYGYIGEYLYISYKDLADDYFETNTSLKSADYNNEVDCSYSSKTASYKYTVTDAPKTITFVWETGNYLSTVNTTSSQYGFTATIKTDQQYSIDLYTDANTIYLNENSSSMFKSCSGVSNLDFIKNWKSDYVTSLSSTFSNCSGLTTTLDLSNWNIDNVTNLHSTFYFVPRVNITGWNTSNVTTFYSTFKYVKTLIGYENLDTSNVTNMDSTFEEFGNADSVIDISNWNTSNVTDMSSMFAYAQSRKSINLSMLNTSNVTSMYNMFCFARFSSIDMSNLNVSKVTNMNYLFEYCYATNINISGWNTESLTQVRQMFYNCDATSIIGHETLNLSKVTSLYEMFGLCYVQELDVSLWNTSNVTDMEETFKSCSNLTSINGLSNLDTSKVTNMISTFNGCTNLTSLDLTGWAPNLEKVYTCFYNCKNLEEIKGLSTWNVSKVWSFSQIFAGCEKLTTEGLGDLSTWDFSSAAIFSNFFFNCKSLTTLDCVTNWNVSNACDNNDLCAVFEGCEKLTKLDLTGWNPVKAISTRGFVKNCKALTEIKGIENWTFDTIDSCNEMFSGCTSLTELDLSNWNMGKVKTMNNMFYNCENLTTVGHLDNWNLSNVTNMTALFFNCKKLTDLGDLSNWSFPKATSLSYLFYYCQSLESIGDLSNWNISNITSISYLFMSCNKLKHIGNISSWDVSKVTTALQMFSSCYELTTDEIGDFSTWNLSKCTSIPIFASCKKLEVIDMSNWNCTQGSSILSAEFSGCTNLKSVDMSGIKVNNATDINGWFTGCTSLQKLRLPIDIPNLTQDKLPTYPKNMYSIQDMMDNFGTDNYRVYQKDSYINPSAYSTNWLVSDYSYTLTYKDTEENELGTQTIDVANGPVTLQGVDNIPESKRMFGWAYTKSDAENGVVNLKTGVIAPNGIFPGIQGLDTATLDDDILVLYAVIGDPLSSTLMKGADFNEALKSLVGVDSAYDEDTRIYNIKWTTEDISSDTNVIHVEQDGETTPVYARLGTETRTITTTEMVSKTRNHTEYVHSDNINDSGNRIGNYILSKTTKTVTITGVTQLTVTVRYGFDAGQDYYAGFFGIGRKDRKSQDDTFIIKDKNGSTIKSYTHGHDNSSTWSGNKTKNETFTVAGDKITFEFTPDGNSQGSDGYGFYATITAVENYEEEEEVSHDETVEVVELYTEAELVYFNEDSSEMFSNFTKLDTLDFINTKVSTINTTDMNYMFYNCQSFKNVDLTKFNTSNVTNFEEMFDSLMTIETLDLSSFDMSKAENVNSMINGFIDKIIMPASIPSTVDTTSIFSLGLGGSSWYFFVMLDDNLDGISDDNISYNNSVPSVSIKTDGNVHTYVRACEINFTLWNTDGITSKFISTDDVDRYTYVDMAKLPSIDLTDIQNDIECEDYNFSHFTDSNEILNIKDSLDTSLLNFGEYASFTLYGKFSEKTFKIVYHVNNPNIVTDYNMDVYEDTTEYVVSESSETLKDNMFTKPGYKFNKWKREDNTLFEENDSLEDICKWDGSVHDTVNMYADWTPIKYTIYIHSNDILDSNNLPIADSVVKTLEVNYDYNAYNELQVLINELIFDGYIDDSNEDCHIICEVNEINTDNFSIVNGRTNMADNRKLNGNHVYKEISLNNIYRSYVLNLSKIDGAELHFYCINSLNKVKSRNGDVNKIVQKMIGNKGEYFAYYTAIYYGDSRVYFKPNNLYSVFDLDSF